MLNELKNLKSVENIDKLVLWSRKNIGIEKIQTLKNFGLYIIQPDVTSLRKDEYFVKDRIVIPNFVVVKSAELNMEYIIKLNLIAEYIVKRLKKLFHLILSEIAAPIYDEYYIKRGKVATKAIIEFEKRILNELIKRLKTDNRHDIAIDVGCGTGRHSFILCKYFDKVYAFDFSSKMIEIAEGKKRKQDIKNILFSVVDFEYEELKDEKDFSGKCDLVVASFGMGSFIENTHKMLRRFYDWLKPGGFVFLSFYNKDTIIRKIVPNWRDTSLSAYIDPESNTLTVELPGSIKYSIYAKPYDNNIESLIKGIFVVDEIYTFLTLMSLMPNDLLEKDKDKFGLFKHIDEFLSSNERYRLGHYVIVIAHKPLITLEGYSNILKILKKNKAKYKILEHKPVYTIEDVKREISYFPNCMIKTVVFKIKAKIEGKILFVIVVLLAEKRVNKDIIAKFLGISRSKLKFAPEKDILRLGFPVGGIAPFGFKENNIKICKFIDEDIINSKCEWFYMGIGDNRKTLKIRREDFLDIVSTYQKVKL